MHSGVLEALFSGRWNKTLKINGGAAFHKIYHRDAEHCT